MPSLPEFTSGGREEERKEIDESFRRQRIYRIPLPEPVIAFRRQIEAGEPFPTPSGKIEIHSQLLQEMNTPEVPPVPRYLEPPEGPRDPRQRQYPLQLITTHPKTKTHSTLNTVPWLKELEPHAVWINPIDAGARGIKTGDQVLVFNDRGKIALQARVTERIMTGVVAIEEGPWYEPDAAGIDRGGNPNVLIGRDHSPGGAFHYNAALVQAQKL